MFKAVVYKISQYKFQSVLVLLVFVLVLSACSRTAQGPLVSPTGVSLSPQPTTIPVNEYFALDIGLFDDKYKNITAQKITVEAIMPSHGHGMNVSPIVTKVQGSQFIADGLIFHMRGDWQVIVYVDFGNKVEKLTFDTHI